MRISDMNWMQVEAYLKHDDRAVLPLGSTEQHGYLSLSTDSILAQKVSEESAEAPGIPVFPVLSYGVTPYMKAYPGTITLRVQTYLNVVGDLLDGMAGSGFKRIALVSGHGGNAPAESVAVEWMADNEDVQVKFLQWWQGPRVTAKAVEIDPVFSHASWYENFPWTRLAGVIVPDEQKVLSDRTGYPRLVGQKLRDVYGDGNFGGFYQHSDKDMLAVWEVAVNETRALLEDGWD